MGILASSSSEPLRDTMVAIIDRMSSTTGTQHATVAAALPPGMRKMRMRSGSTERSLRNAGNIGM